jgi:hypothetical protein
VPDTTNYLLWSGSESWKPFETKYLIASVVSHKFVFTLT